MSSSITISLPSYNALDRFCSTNKVSRVAIIKLAFAVVLHQYFDLPDFTCSEALPQNHDDPTRFSINRTRQVQYTPELASTISLQAVLGLKDTDSSAGDDLAPLLVEHQTTTVLNGKQFASSRPAASLLFARTVAVPTEPSLSSLVAHQVSGLGMSSCSHVSLIRSP
jgi:hypothetical protein